MTQWYVKDLSSLTGISVQTLHHYDRIDLLKPSVRLSNGYRLYSEKDLLRLQQIIALKYFGFELSKIKELLCGTVNMASHLKVQARCLAEEAKKLKEASETLESIIPDCSINESIPWETIIKLIEVYQMKQDNYYHFDSERQSNYERHLIETGRMTPQQVAEAHEKIKKWDMSELDSYKEQGDEINKKLASALLRKVPVSSDEVQALIRKSYALVCKFWVPSREKYISLGQVYVENKEFSDMFDTYAKGLAQYISDAIAVFAERELR